MAATIPKITLAEKPSVPETEMTNMLMLIYGEPKVGKSTFCSTIPGAYFIATESGHRNLSVYKTDVTSYAEIVETVRLICEDKRFSTVIFDTVTNTYDLICDHLVKKYNCDHINDGRLSYGKGFHEARQIFKGLIEYIVKSGRGAVFVSHEVLKDSNFHGVEKSRYLANLTKSARDAVMPVVDVIGRIYLDRVQEGGKMVECRVINFKNNVEFEAGDRTNALAICGPIVLRSPESCWSDVLERFSNEIIIKDKDKDKEQ